MDRKRVGLAVLAASVAIAFAAWIVARAAAPPVIEVSVPPGPQARTRDEPEPDPLRR